MSWVPKRSRRMVAWFRFDPDGVRLLGCAATFVGDLQMDLMCADLVDRRRPIDRTRARVDSQPSGYQRVDCRETDVVPVRLATVRDEANLQWLAERRVVGRRFIGDSDVGESAVTGPRF